jgi:pimeloyl-ACP methyl ester carboxylesterase
MTNSSPTSESACQTTTRDTRRIIFWANRNRNCSNRPSSRRAYSCIQLCGHPLATQFAAFARLLDLRWIPATLVVAALTGSAATPELRVRLREVLATLPREIVRARAQDMLRVDKRGRLREIKCPVLCLHGRSDRLVSKKHVDEIVAAQPGCEVYWLDSSHMLLATHTEAAARVIENFCEHLICQRAVASA